MTTFSNLALGALVSLSSLSSVALANSPAVDAAYRLKQATNSEHMRNHTYATEVSYMNENDNRAILRVKLGGPAHANSPILHDAKWKLLDQLRGEGFTIKEQVTQSEGSRPGPSGKPYPMTWTHYEAEISK